MAGFATGATGFVLVGVGLYLASRAASDATQVASFRGEWTAAQRATEHDGQTAALWGKLTLGVGIAGIATGVVLYYVGVKRHGLDFVFTPKTAGVTWAASF